MCCPVARFLTNSLRYTHLRQLFVARTRNFIHLNILTHLHLLLDRNLDAWCCRKKKGISSTQGNIDAPTHERKSLDYLRGLNGYWKSVGKNWGIEGFKFWKGPCRINYKLWTGNGLELDDRRYILGRRNFGPLSRFVIPLIELRE